MLDVWDCQFLNVDDGIFAYSLGLHNVLFSEADGDASIYLEGAGTLTCENVTCDGGVFDGPLYFALYPDQVSVTLINCLITFSDGNGGTYVSTDNTNWTDTFIAIYQTIGAGRYYLAPGSPYHNAGTTNISPALLADLATKTTYPPTVYSNVTLALPLTLNPHVRRDTNGLPDFGYHYPPLDYAFGGVNVATNLTVSAGTAVGWFYNLSVQGYGLALGDGVTATFNGTATNPCIFARYNTVQEGGNGQWASQGWLAGVTGQAYNNTAPVISANFTHCYQLNSEGNIFRDHFHYMVQNAVNCEFWSRGFGDYSCSANATNCLFFRGGAAMFNDAAPDNLALENCTFIGGSLTVANYGGGGAWPLTIVNCAFDGTVITMNENGNGAGGAYCDYNAFLLNSNLTCILGGHEVTNLATFNWQPSWLGAYYLPANSPLLQAGSTTANTIGLSGFTTQNSQIPQGNATVDIGYHYWALAGTFPIITREPTNEVVTADGTAVFNLAVSGVGPDTYEWLFDGVPSVLLRLWPAFMIR